MNAETVTVKVPAKVNLSLLITGTDGGYHSLDSVVCSVNVYDTVRVTARGDGAVSFSCSNAVLPENNTAVRAARAFVAAYGTAGADVFVEKGIPEAAGLGGSSADAAGVLNALYRLYNPGHGERLAELAASVGSDVPYMLQGGFARLRGRGERVEPIRCRVPLYFVLAKPETGVSTAAAYALYDALPLKSGGDNAALCAALEKGALPPPELFVNDLYPPAAKLNPEVARLLTAARALGPHAAFMTGSGSAVAALFSSEAEAERARAQLAPAAAYSVTVRAV